MFVDAHVIPDGTDPNDAKIYFFFKEKLTDNSRSTKQIHSMIARICPVSINILKFNLFKLKIQTPNSPPQKQNKTKIKTEFTHFNHFYYISLSLETTDLFLYP